MLTKGRTYQFRADGDSILLEDFETHEIENVRSDAVYLFEKSEQVKLVPGVVTLKPGDKIECILDMPVVFGVDELYYPHEHTIVYCEQDETILDLFPELCQEELSVMHKVLIPENLRNDVISITVLKQLITNFVKQSLVMFTRSVYESTKNRINREIVMKLIFGVYSTNKLMEIAPTKRLIVNTTNDIISISYLGNVIAWYDYPSLGEEVSV